MCHGSFLSFAMFSFQLMIFLSLVDRFHNECGGMWESHRQLIFIFAAICMCKGAHRLFNQLPIECFAQATRTYIQMHLHSGFFSFIEHRIFFGCIHALNGHYCCFCISKYNSVEGRAFSPTFKNHFRYLLSRDKLTFRFFLY